MIAVKTCCPTLWPHVDQPRMNLPTSKEENKESIPLLKTTWNIPQCLLRKQSSTQLLLQWYSLQSNLDNVRRPCWTTLMRKVASRSWLHPDRGWGFRTAGKEFITTMRLNTFPRYGSWSDFEVSLGRSADCEQIFSDSFQSLFNKDEITKATEPQLCSCRNGYFSLFAKQLFWVSSSYLEYGRVWVYKSKRGMMQQRRERTDR